MSKPSDSPGGDETGGQRADPSGPPSDLSAFDIDLLNRLKEVAGHFTYSEISRQTGIHRESCRRYLVHGKPTMEFLAVLCQSMGISAHWLLLGVGPRTRHEDAAAWLHTIEAPELVLELGRRWQASQALVADLRERLVRLEARVRQPDPYGEPAQGAPSFVEGKPLPERVEPGSPLLPSPPPGLPPDSGLKYDAPYGGGS
jgi:hypothetical protein